MELLGIFGGVMIFVGLHRPAFDTRDKFAVIIGCVCLIVSVAYYMIDQVPVRRSVAATLRANAALEDMVSGNHPGDPSKPNLDGR